MAGCGFKNEPPKKTDSLKIKAGVLHPIITNSI